MKLLVVSLDSAVPELLLREERLTNIRRLMHAGCFGRMDGVDAPTHDPLNPANSLSTSAQTIRDEIARNGGRSILLGVPVDPDEHSTHDRDSLYAGIVSSTRRNFDEARELLGPNDWAYFQLFEPGLERMQHGFRDDQDILHNYYQLLDEELGTLLALIDDDTAVLVYSGPGAGALKGEFFNNGSQDGAIVLAVPGQSARGEIEGARLLDLAPTLLDLAGCEIPASMQGRSLVHVQGTQPPVQSEWFDFVDPSVEERLRGLGYLG
jgi:predicted AlkP superfamily phosphohydrolase/phosphomutase